MGSGSVQFFDNAGNELVNGVLYLYQAGTTLQQQSYTDYTCTVQNPNPITFSSGGRATIWLATGSFYKIVLCLQNDGSFCASSDILYSVDQVPGAASGGGGGGGGSPFTGIFISSTAGASTSGILRLASSDTVCWRNAANTANLCWSKNSNDLLGWSAGSLLFPETTSVCGSAVAGSDLIWADNSAHRWMMANNGGSCSQLVASGVDINTSDQVVQQHFGSTGLPNCATAPSSGQALENTGTCIGGATVPNVSSQISAPTNTGNGLSAQTIVASMPTTTAVYLQIQPVISTIGTSCSASANNITFSFTFTSPGGTTLTYVNNFYSFSGNGVLDDGSEIPVGPNDPTGGRYAFYLPSVYSIVAKVGTSITYTTSSILGATGCATIPQYTMYTKAIY